MVPGLHVPVGMRPEYVPSVLVPVEVKRGEDELEMELSPLLVEFLSPLHVVLLGYFVVPEQTPLDQARDQFGEELAGELDALVNRFGFAGTEDLTTRFVFTNDAAQTMERVANEEECDALLIPAESRGTNRILVPLRSDTNLKMILYFVKSLIADSDVESVTLLTVAETEGAADGKDLMLEGARERLEGMGVQQGLVEIRVEVSKDPVARISEVSKDYDVMVMGESEPSVSTLVFGEVPERVGRRADIPVLVVRGAAD